MSNIVTMDFQDENTKKLEMLKSLNNQRNDFLTCDKIYNEIINEYENYCLLMKSKGINYNLDKIAKHRNKIEEYKLLINDLELAYDTFIEKEVARILKSQDIVMELKKQKIFNNINTEAKNRNKTIADFLHFDIFKILLSIELKKNITTNESEEIGKIRAKIESFLEEVNNLLNQNNQLHKAYVNRHTEKFINFEFSNPLKEIVKNNLDLLNKSFSIIQSNEKSFCKIYDKILYMFTNCELFVKNDERSLMAKEWFLELSLLTFYQFEKTKDYFKNNSFTTRNPLKEFKEKSEEIKNIQFLLSL